MDKEKLKQHKYLFKIYNERAKKYKDKFSEDLAKSQKNIIKIGNLK